VHTIGRREDICDGSLDLFGRRVIYSGRRGEDFLRRDTDFRIDAEGFVPREYFSATRVAVSVAALRVRAAAACAASAAPSSR
jgi:hypothetical protein